MHLPGQLPLEQARVAELAPALVQVLGPVRELAQVQLQELELALGSQLEREPPLVLVQGRELARQQELAAVPESPKSQELAAVLKQARELRVSRQQEQQQHHLLAAAQELLPCRPVLPMKAPC